MPNCDAFLRTLVFCLSQRKDFALHLFRPSKKPHVILRLKRIVIESFSVGFRMSVHRRLLVVVLGTWGLVHPSSAEAGDRLAKPGGHISFIRGSYLKGIN